MKKILSLILAVLVFASVFAFSSCGSDKKAAVSEPTVEFVSDVNSAKPGEEVTVKLHLYGVEFFACLTATIDYDSSVVAYEKYSAYKSDSYYDLFNDSGDSSVYYGYVATTENIADADLLTVTYQISEDAVSGTTTEITLNIEELGVGTDESGDTVNELCDSFAPITLEIKIK